MAPTIYKHIIGTEVWEVCLASEVIEYVLLREKKAIRFTQSIYGDPHTDEELDTVYDLFLSWKEEKDE